LIARLASFGRADYQPFRFVFFGRLEQPGISLTLFDARYYFIGGILFPTNAVSKATANRCAIPAQRGLTRRGLRVSNISSAAYHI